MLLSLAAWAEGNIDMPRVGEVVQGFELVETHEFDLIGAVVYRFEHQSTGAEVFYVRNEDTNRAFDMAFRTQAIDDTGLPHVFEHATLSGSEKYPSKDLWFNLANGSYVTYMNASTSRDHTQYPIASLSEDQLLSLADFYVDSCLHPMVMEDESIFREEAWRYRLDTPEDQLTIEGTVYSEMLGAVTLQRSEILFNQRMLMPGSYAGNDSGGLPAAIPDMTWESLKGYHDLYYHPSNSVTYLYGKLDNYEDFLSLLDGAFTPYERRSFDLTQPGYTPIEAPVEAQQTFPVEAGTDTANKSSITYSILLPGLRENREDRMKLETLITLLQQPASQLCQRMERELPDAMWNVGVGYDAVEPYFTAYLRNCDPEDRDTFVAIINECLDQVTRQPFATDMMDAVSAQLEIETRLMADQANIGVDLISDMIGSYLGIGDPWAYIEGQMAIGQAIEWNEAGVFGDIVQKYLLDNPQTAITMTTPEPGGKEAQDAALAERLAEVKANMTEAEIADIVKDSNAPTQENPRTAEMLEALTAVTVQSLPEEMKLHEVLDETDQYGYRHLESVAQVEGIGIPAILLDVADLPQEDIHWFHLFTNLAGELDTSRHTHEELDTLWSRYLYNGDIRLSLGKDGEEGYHVRLRLEWTAIDQDLAAGYDLMREIVFDTRFDDVDLIREQVEGYASSLRSSINNSSFNYEMTRAFGTAVPRMRLSAYYNGLDYYDFLRQVVELCETDPQTVTRELNHIKALVNNAENAIAVYVGAESGREANRPLAERFLSGLWRREVIPARYNLPTAAPREAMIVDSAVAFNGITVDYETLGTEYSAEMDVVAQIVTDLYLLPELRTRYGAYGAYNGFYDDCGMEVYSYRDPNIRETFQVYEALPQFLEDLTLDQTTLDRYILSVYQGYALPVGELSGAMNAISDKINDEDPQRYLQDMRTLKAMTPERVKSCTDLYRGLIEQGVRFTTGGASAINEANDLYDQILNPFGVADLSDQTFADVTEDRDDYEVIRYVYEEGLMAPREADRFGADDPATVGDLAYALNQLISEEPATPEEAVENLKAYQILLGEDNADAPLTAWDADDILNAFTAAVGAEYPGKMAGEAEPYTRADLARTLAAYVGWMDSVFAVDGD